MPHLNQQLWAFAFEFSTSVSSGSNTTVERTVEEDVMLHGFTIVWPDGTNNQVGVQLRTKSGDKLFPRNPEDDFIASNDFGDTFPLMTVVQEDETLVVEFQNDDPNNGHFVNAIVRMALLDPDAEFPDVPGLIGPGAQGSLSSSGHSQQPRGGR